MLSYLFIGLNSFLSIISSYNIKSKVEVLLILSLTFIINLLFLTDNLFHFYILFELTLPLLFILIAVKGSSNRIKASFYIFLYTLFGSLLLLVGILVYTSATHNLYISGFQIANIPSINLEILIYILILIGFLVKLPLVPFHIWLSYAHSEAPASGSVILAGIILKLAIYGILIILINTLSNAHEILNEYVIILALITLFYITGITLCANDTKVIVAYSSIAHLAVCTIALFSNNIYGLIGCILFSLAHGLASPGLFLLVGDYIYQIYHTRITSLIKGLMQYSPVLAIFTFLFCLANISFPGTFNFYAEFLCISGAKFNLFYLTGTAFTILFSGLLIFRLLTQIIFRDNYFINPSYFITRTQLYSLVSLMIPLIYFGISNELFFPVMFSCLDFLV